MKKRMLLIINCMIIICCLTSCENKKYYISQSVIYTEINELHSGDAKFYKDKVITGVNSKLAIISMDGEIEKMYSDVNVNWLDAIDDNVLIYGNFNKEIGVIELDDENNIISNSIIMTTENLQIDPTITLLDGVYYVTVTEIIGKVNNSDENEKNGEYILHLYSSGDLKEWTHVSDIVDDYNNIEDVDISITKDKIMYVVYEKEEIDKGKSAIVLKQSDDMGKTWGEEIVLMEAEADQEPAILLENGKKMVLYYSSDISSPGDSYMGASVYYSIYDSKFNLLEKGNLVDTENKKGILLYDIAEINDELYLLYAHDYLATNDLIIEKSN